MEQNRFARSAFAPEAAAIQPASPVNHAAAAAQADEAAAQTRVVNTPDAPGFNVPLLSDCLNDTLAETFPPGARKPRHDGWTPEAIGGFLRHLAASGIVDHAAASVGLSVSAAYAFRNRRQGRAFARMWDAILIHRSRARLASESQARAIAGCVSVRKKDGLVVSEYHYYDNRLATAMLTRLDRLAEKEAASEAHLRALSEDLDDYIDCVAAGGDTDAFVEARRPVQPGPAAAPAPGEAEAGEPDSDPELTRFATLSGCPHYRDVDPLDIEVLDLDPDEKAAWNADQWVRAWRSGFMTWLSFVEQDDAGFTSGPGTPFRFFFEREASAAAAAARDSAETAVEAGEQEIDTADLDPAAIDDWTDDQLARAWNSGFLRRLPDEYWDDLADRAAAHGEAG